MNKFVQFLKDSYIEKASWEDEQVKQFELLGDLEQRRRDLNDQEKSLDERERLLKQWRGEQDDREKALTAKEHALKLESQALAQRFQTFDSNSDRLANIEATLAKLVQLSMKSNRSSIGSTLVDDVEPESSDRRVSKRMADLVMSPIGQTGKRVRKRDPKSSILEPEAIELDIPGIDSILDQSLLPNPNDDVFGHRSSSASRIVPAVTTLTSSRPPLMPSAPLSMPPPSRIPVLPSLVPPAPQRLPSVPQDHPSLSLQLPSTSSRLLSQGSASLPSTSLSSDLEAVFAKLVFPDDFSAAEIQAFRAIMLHTAGDENRHQSTYVYDSIAREPAKGIPGFSCWSHKLQNKGTRLDANTICGICLRQNVKFLYFTFVTGVVTEQQGLWNGTVFNMNVGRGTIIETISGKRWNVHCRRLLR
ncbi:hypothetical protein MMC17_004454 [Xylographa soralifera]|nr:hypothetical protein [Xylographa soralifera]